ncbi:DNA-binding protein HU [Campylobacter hyointestinalis]|uniref:HU family DNA-binding protein n=1 Tax=Campylobacter hyointestinalis TaxID=198 RepID=UPI00072754AD|nr:HU family DNA-binding protein [Campylobacter hyointestinalis]PPB55834.1 HU family DNA-binding protein [Campylobacter hyointestinalis subsp. hyointestinalis]CUU77301.1 DNA-binding protein HU [Campylobacter hyointestinalis]
MTKAEFVGLVASKAGLTKKDTELALDGFLESIIEVLTKGDSITFVGFGTFGITERAARTAKVPSTGKEIKVPAKKAVKFKVGKNLKDAVAKVSCGSSKCASKKK